MDQDEVCACELRRGLVTWATRSPTSRWTWSSGRQSLHDSFMVDDYGTPTTYRNSTPDPLPI